MTDQGPPRTNHSLHESLYDDEDFSEEEKKRHTFAVWLTIEEHRPGYGRADVPGDEYLTHDPLDVGRTVTMGSHDDAHNVCQAINGLVVALQGGSIQDGCEAIGKLAELVNK